MTRRSLRRAVVPVAAAATLALSACGAANEESSQEGDSGSSSANGQNLSATLAGAGASTQQVAHQTWSAKFSESNPDATVNYDPVGSGGGRKQFISGGVDFGGTDAALDEKELPKAKERCGGNLIEMPVYISPIAIAYKLDGVSELKLAPKTMAKIFSGEITNWNNEAIKAENPDADLPDQRIAPVHRSDDSGTTENFTDYLKVAAGSAWDYKVTGNWPISGGEAAQGTSGVVDAINAGNGTIGYADASQVQDLDVAKVKVGESYVGPSAEAAGKILEASERISGRGENVFTYDLARDTTESGTYPVVLTSYELVCGSYDDEATAKTVQGYMTYVISEKGQQAAAEAAGSAPITDSLRDKLKPAVDSISTAS